MSLRGKKLGLLLSISPTHPNFARGLKLAEAAMAESITVYLYCIDEAVPGITTSEMQTLKEKGAHLFACAYGAQKRSLALSDKATFVGLSVANDIIANTDRFVCF